MSVTQVIASLLAMNGILMAIAGFFAKQFVSNVQLLSRQVADMDRQYHARLSVLEQANGVYNAFTRSE